MFIKDFDCFVNRQRSYSGHEYFDNMLVSLEGEPWKEMRSIITSMFSTGRLKDMSILANVCAKDFIYYLNELAEKKIEVNSGDITGMFTMQFIASCGFGIETSFFGENHDGKQFIKMARKLLGHEVTAWDMVKGLAAHYIPGVGLLCKVLDIKCSPYDEESLFFFADMIKKTLAQRKKQSKRRNDMIDFLTEALYGKEQNKADLNSDEKIETLIISNVLLLFLAGYRQIFARMDVCMLYLANNITVQERLYEEIHDASQMDGDVGYDTIMNMQYLDMVVMESLRHHPLSEVESISARDYAIPGTRFTIPKGMTTKVPASGIMMDERYFPNPTEFDPEHFSPEKIKQRNPNVNLVFGFGPRACVAKRLALLIMKIGIAHVIHKFKILPTSRTPDKFELDPASPMNSVKGGIWIKFEKRDGEF